MHTDCVAQAFLKCLYFTILQCVSPIPRVSNRALIQWALSTLQLKPLLALLLLLWFWLLRFCLSLLTCRSGLLLGLLLCLTAGLFLCLCIQNNRGRKERKKEREGWRERGRERQRKVRRSSCKGKVTFMPEKMNLCNHLDVEQRL